MHTGALVKPLSDRVLTDHLSANSAPYYDPLSCLPWDKLSLDDYWLPIPAISLYGLPEFDKLDELQKIRLSQYEFISFIRAGIWLEQLFVERLIKAARTDITPSEHIYYLHEIREETGHMLMFHELMKRSGLAMPKLKRPWPFLADFIGRHFPSKRAFFWMAVVIGEEVPDKLNRQIRMLDGESYNPLIREMCTFHIKDEARHIAFARDELARRMRDDGSGLATLSAPLLNVLLNQFVRSFYLPHASYYEFAGLHDGKRWREKARHNPARQQFVMQAVSPTIRFFKEIGLDLRITYF